MLESMNGTKSKNRELDVLHSPDQRKHIIEKHLLNQTLIIKGDEEGSTLTIKKFIPEGERLLVELNGDLDLASKNEMILYRILAKYVQLECFFQQSINGKMA